MDHFLKYYSQKVQCTLDLNALFLQKNQTIDWQSNSFFHRNAVTM